MTEPGRFAILYWSHYVRGFQTFDTLADAVSAEESAMDTFGAAWRSSGTFYALDDGQWVPVTAEDIATATEVLARQRRHREALVNLVPPRATTHRVVLIGPEGAEDVWSDFASEAAARRTERDMAAKGYPVRVDPI